MFDCEEVKETERRRRWSLRCETRSCKIWCHAWKSALIWTAIACTFRTYLRFDFSKVWEKVEIFEKKKFCNFTFKTSFCFTKIVFFFFERRDEEKIVMDIGIQLGYQVGSESYRPKKTFSLKWPATLFNWFIWVVVYWFSYKCRRLFFADNLEFYK